MELFPALVANDLEFIELYNRSAASVDLFGMRLQSAIDYEFDEHLELEPGAALVVLSFDPRLADNLARASAFRLHYGIGDSVRLAGGYSGSLRDLGDHIQLTNPGERFGIGDFVVEDFAYDDEAPWPPTSDSGNSLHRDDPASFAALPEHWTAMTPTPGTTRFKSIRTGDFTQDGRLDIEDVDLMWAQLRIGNGDLRFDLNGDDQIDDRDRDRMILEILGTTYGDTNLDGQFNSSDFVLVFQIGEYEDSIAGNSTWSDGDWNGDGDFTTGDLVLAFQTGQYVANARIDPGDLAAAVDWAFMENRHESRTFLA